MADLNQDIIASGQTQANTPPDLGASAPKEPTAPAAIGETPQSQYPVPQTQPQPQAPAQTVSKDQAVQDYQASQVQTQPQSQPIPFSPVSRDQAVADYQKATQPKSYQGDSWDHFFNSPDNLGSTVLNKLGFGSNSHGEFDKDLDEGTKEALKSKDLQNLSKERQAILTQQSQFLLRGSAMSGLDIFGITSGIVMLSQMSQDIGAETRSATRSVVPTAGGLAGGLRGSMLGARFGWLGALGGGILGALGGGAVTEYAQRKAIEALPEGVQKALGQDQETLAQDQKTSPISSEIGSLAPQALFMSPGKVPLLVRALNTMIMGGLETGQEIVHDGKVDPTKIALAAGSGALFSQAYGLGRKIEGMIGYDAFLAKARSENAVGTDEGAFFGTKQQSPEEEKTYNSVQEELAAQRVSDPTTHDIARNVAPDVFEEYDNLDARKNVLRNTLANLEAPEDRAPLNEELLRIQQRQDELSPDVKTAYGLAQEALGTPKVEPAQYRVNRENLTPEASQRLQNELQGMSGAEKTQPLARALEVAVQPELDLSGTSTRRIIEAIQQARRLGREDVVDTLVGKVTDAVDRAAPEAKGRVLKEAQRVFNQARKEPVKELDFIKQDVSRRLQGQGMAKEKADANGEIVQRLYYTHSTRFKGARGTPEEIYKKEAPIVVSEKGKMSLQFKGRTLSQYIGTKAYRGTSEGIGRSKKLSMATKMESENKTPEQIRAATGWFRGLDKNWRFEVSDDRAQLRPEFDSLPERKLFDNSPETETTLGKVLDHEELYRAYPDARNIKITKRAGLFDFFGSLQGSFSEENNEINVTPYAQDKLSTLLHEVQHWIQHKEGFAGGGSPETVIQDLPEPKREQLFHQAIQNVTDKINDLRYITNKIRNIPQEIFDSLHELWANDDQKWKAWQAATKGLEEFFPKGRVKGEELLYDQIKEEEEIFHSLWTSSYRATQEAEVAFMRQLVGKKSWFDFNQQEKYLWFKAKGMFATPKPQTVEDVINQSQKSYDDLRTSLSGLESGDEKSLKRTLSSDQQHKLYQLIAGEIEARDTQARREFDSTSRSEVKPYSSEQFDPDDVIFSSRDSREMSQSLVNDEDVNKSITDLRAANANLKHGDLTAEDKQAFFNLKRYFSDMAYRQTPWESEEGMVKSHEAILKQLHSKALEALKLFSEHGINYLRTPELQNKIEDLFHETQDLHIQANDSETLHDDLRFAQSEFMKDMAPGLAESAKDLQDHIKKYGEVSAEHAEELNQLTDRFYKDLEKYQSNVGTDNVVPFTQRILDQIKRGSIKLIPGGKNVIELMEKYDASTFMHETAHDWLERLARDAEHPEAPEELQKDVADIRKWLGNKGGVFSEKEHELFASGFEKYLAEGHAPTPTLEVVFRQFKEWLLEIYKAVSNIKATAEGKEHEVPLNDNVRQVFDRMLSEEPRKTVIEPKPKSRVGRRSTKVSPNAPKATETPVDDKTPAATNKSSKLKKDTDGKFVNKAGNINLENLTSEKDLQDCVQEVVGWSKAGLEQARGGVVTATDRISMASDLAVDSNKADEVLDHLESLLPGPESLSVKVSALKAIVRQAAQNVIDTAKTDNYIEYFAAREKLLAVSKTFSGVVAEWGRTGQALKADAKKAQIDQVLTEFLQSQIGKTTKDIQAEIEAIKEFDQAGQVTKFLRDADKPRLGGMVLEYYVNSLISGFITHTQYLLSTLEYTMLRNYVDLPVQAVVSGLHDLIDPSSTKGRTYFRQIPGVATMANGAWNGIKAAGTSFVTGNIALLPGEESAGNIINTGRKQIPGLLGTLARIPGERMVGPFHSFNRTWNFSVHKASLIAQQVSEEGLSGRDFSIRAAQLEENTPINITVRARTLANEDTLMGQTGAFTNSFIGLINKFNLLGFKPLKFLIPFVPMASNINKLAFMDRTPLGLFSKDIRDDMSGKNGRYSQDMAITKMATGLILYTSFGLMYLNGNLTSGPATDAREANVKKWTEGAPYSIRVGELSYEISRTGPVGQMMAMSADLAHFLQHEADSKTDEEKQQAAWQLLVSMNQHLTQEGMLSGVSDMFKASTDPERFGKNWAENFVANFAVPYVSGMRQAANLIDPNQRAVHSLTDAIKARIPLVSETLTPRVDVFGNPVPNKDFMGVYTERVSNDPVWKLLENTPYFPAPVRQDINGVKLNAEEYYEYATQAGQISHRLMSAYASDPAFQNTPEKQKHDLVKDAFVQGRNIARQTILANPKNLHIITDSIRTKNGLAGITSEDENANPENYEGPR